MGEPQPQGAVDAGALIVGNDARAEPDEGPRRSRLFDDGTRLAAADLHNHTLLSDGAGRPEDAFASLRDAGLDVAAVTDHAKIGKGILSRFDPCGRLAGTRPHGWCRGIVGLDEEGWRLTGRVADAADAAGVFTAIRGFEWTHPTLGHVNVWFSPDWVDPLSTSGVGWDGLGDELRRIPGIGPVLDQVLDSIPGDPGMRPLYDWLSAGGSALAGFNHPGREPGWFDAFRHDPRMADRVVSVEAFNKMDDYLFDSPHRSALAACLDAGWRVGLLGVSDEHGDDWGRPAGKGRAGLWVRELSRRGVREALVARRFFATRERGLRLDASADGVRMGGVVAHRRGPVTFALDVDAPGWAGRRVDIQVLRPGGELPAVAHVEEIVVPAGDQPVVRFAVPLDADDGRWVVLRLADPDAPTDAPGPAHHPGNRRALAYASPFWLDPASISTAGRAASGRRPRATEEAGGAFAGRRLDRGEGSQLLMSEQPAGGWR